MLLEAEVELVTSLPHANALTNSMQGFLCSLFSQYCPIFGLTALPFFLEIVLVLFSVLRELVKRFFMSCPVSSLIFRLPLSHFIRFSIFENQILDGNVLEQINLVNPWVNSCWLHFSGSIKHLLSSLVRLQQKLPCNWNSSL